MLERIKRFARHFFKEKELTDEEQNEIYRKMGAKIGTNVHIIGTVLENPPLLSIGNNTTVTRCTVFTHDASTKKAFGYTKFGPVSIGDNCFIGAGSIILPNTKIGNKVIVGAGSIVAKDIPENSVVVGNPLKKICTYDEYIAKEKAKFDAGVHFDKTFQELNEEEVKTFVEAGGGFLL